MNLQHDNNCQVIGVKVIHSFYLVKKKTEDKSKQKEQNPGDQ